MMKQFDHMIEPKLNLELSNVFPRLKFLAGCGQLVILVISHSTFAGFQCLLRVLKCSYEASYQDQIQSRQVLMPTLYGLYIIPRLQPECIPGTKLRILTGWSFCTAWRSGVCFLASLHGVLPYIFSPFWFVF
jgi:hypothetical protein